MREHVATFLLLLVAAFSVAIFISYKGSGTTSPVLTFLIAPATTSAPATPGADLNIVSNAPKTERKKGDGKRKLEKMEDGLARSRAAIRRAIMERNFTSRKRQSFVPRGPIYHNPYAFHQSYIEMEKRLKIWVYKEGEPPLFHDGIFRGLYSVDGHFIDQMDHYSPFVTNDPDNALIFFLPFSVERLVKLVHQKGTYYQSIQTVMRDYVQLISSKYPYWNRTNGADHFLLSCHDWAPYVTKDQDPFKNLVRVMCNANTTEGFNPRRDVSLPEFNIPFYLPVPVRNPSPPSSKTLLAFFAGANHGSVRKFLFEQWNRKDQQIQLFEHLPKGLNYTEFMMKSKYCLCPSGYEVASPRITEAIISGCVPVPISDGYVLPFSDVLDWTQFSVPIPVPRIPEIKEILSAIPESTYLKLQANVMKVQRHFMINRPARRFDVMHMLLHSIWLRRLDVRLTQ
ncbi:probable glycosyltransferase At5g11130 isoform X1 [Nymphaea colorata]|nr:probable glycosyltransferase At5g11130 isoform X1 [Nymphaea colorata]